MFKVIYTPCIQDLNDYIIFNTDLGDEVMTAQVDKNKDSLIYYINRGYAISYTKKTVFGFWIVCFIVDILRYFLF